jgi:hypothetical protein
MTLIKLMVVAVSSGLAWFTVYNCYTVYTESRTEYDPYGFCYAMGPVGVCALACLLRLLYGNSSTPVTLEDFQAKLLDKNKLTDETTVMNLSREKAIGFLAKLSNRYFRRVSNRCVHIAEASVATFLLQAGNTTGTSPDTDPNADPKAMKYHANQQAEQEKAPENDESKKFVDIRNNLAIALKALDDKPEKVRVAKWKEWWNYAKSNGAYSIANDANASLLPPEILYPQAGAVAYIVINESYMSVAYACEGLVPDGYNVLFVVVILTTVLSFAFGRSAFSSTFKGVSGMAQGFFARV